jgi:prepilin-type N-terminal cleavage/methylation domain-containing protein
MKDQRGFTLVELLVASLIGAIAAMAMGSFYVAMVNSFAWAGSETVLQRQGGLALDAIGNKVRQASGVGAACAPAGTAGTSLRITISPPLAGAGDYCYYAGSGANGATAGALCERYTSPAGVAAPCRDLLSEGQGGLARKTRQARLTILTQTAPGSAACPRLAVAGAPGGTPLAAGQPCLILSSPAGAASVELAVAITDGMAVREFAATFNFRN